MATPDRYEPLPSLAGIPGWLLRKVPPARRRMAVAAVALATLAVAVAGVLVIVGAQRDERDRAAAEARAQKAGAAARRARYQREARPHSGRGPAAGELGGAAALKARRTLVAGLEAAVLADARARTRRGELEGDHRSATCSRYPKGVEPRPPQDDLSIGRATMECLAVLDSVARSEQTTGSIIGHPFRARVDFDQGRYTWCKIVQRPGELSFDKEPVVRIPRACGGS